MGIPTPEPGLVLNYADLWHDEHDAGQEDARKDRPSVIAEGNEFAWPGYDLRKVPKTDQYEFGFLPPRFFNQILDAFVALHKAGNTKKTSRT